MLKRILIITLFLANVILLCGQFQIDQTYILNNYILIHHTVGKNILDQGGVRNYINQYNQMHGSNFELWDHGYNSEGLTNPEGINTNTNYQIPYDSIDPWAIHYLWATTYPDANYCRDEMIADHHEVIAIMIDCSNPVIDSDERLEQYKAWFLEMRPILADYSEHNYIIITAPPLKPEATNAEDAHRARLFANWLKSDEYLEGYFNLSCFDLFDLLATADSSGNESNMLKPEYRREDQGESLPNETANQDIGPLMAQFFIDHCETKKVNVQLDNFTIETSGNQYNTIQFATRYEVCLMAYRIYRNSLQDSTIQCISDLIPCNNVLIESFYTYIDHDVDSSQVYRYWLEAINITGYQRYFGPISNGEISNSDNVVSIDKSPIVLPPYPNPFRNYNQLSFELEKRVSVKVEIYNIKGQKVQSFSQREGVIGKNYFQWDGRDFDGKHCSSGLYFYKIQAGKSIETRKVLYLK